MPSDPAATTLDAAMDGEADDAASATTRADELAMMRGIRAGLLAHCGARPTEVQRGLVDRAMWLRLYLHRMDQLALARGQVWSGKGAVQYLAYSRELTNTLGKLGGAAAKPAKADPFEYLAAINASHGDAADAE
jgi:hypothetical protein